MAVSFPAAGLSAAGFSPATTAVWISRQIGQAAVSFSEPAGRHLPGSHTSDTYRADIDGLRAIAVLSVVAFHATSRLPGGFVGVNVFFVISGYLISRLLYRDLHTGTFSFADFYGRRIRRLAPALILVLSSLLSLGWWTLLATEYQSLGRHTTAGAVFLSNFLLWREVGYFDTGAALKPLLHLWSLGIEEQFYVLWPLCLFLAWGYRWGVLGLLAGLAGVSFVLGISRLQSASMSAFYLPDSRLWELLIGASVAHIEFSDYWKRAVRQATGRATCARGRGS